jgi:hypothetical protein
MAHIVTMGQPCRRAHIASYKDAVILGNNTARTATTTGGTFSYRIANFHKIIIPVGTSIGYILFRHTFILNQGKVFVKGKVLMKRRLM